MSTRRSSILAVPLLLGALVWGLAPVHAAVGPNPAVNYNVPNFTNSPILPKFVDALPGLTAANKNLLGQYIPVATPDKVTYASTNSDYYEISLVEYTEKMHSNLSPTKLRGYVQTNLGTDPLTGLNTVVPDPVHYLGPLIIAQRDRPVRIKFTNNLPIGAAGDLFIPVDTTIMGAGMGPLDMPGMPGMKASYTQNRATLHLHGGLTPWISDGTPNQWTVPATENTVYPRGVSVQFVPDMWFDPVTHKPVPAGTAGATNDPGPGSLTFYYTNAQSARLMFYHDHAYGLTRLNVYAGEAAGYLIQDPVEQALVNGGTVGTTIFTAGTIPAAQIPLVIQDRTFVPDAATLAATDPSWDTAAWGGTGNLWFPHVYMINQDPFSPMGGNNLGRWDWGPWFWPPQLAGTAPGDLLYPMPPALSAVPEAFMDTPVVNGTAYPYVNVQPTQYRLRILNACNDRHINLQFYVADPLNPTEVRMVPAVSPTATSALPPAPAGASISPVTGLPTGYWPATWPTDGRDGGVPDPTLAGPQMIQIGTEGGLLPAPALIPSCPVGYEYNRRNIVVLNVSTHALFLGPAERADVVVDFSAFAGQTLILYNDSPAPVPGFDPRYDYYTGDPDHSLATGDGTGGAPTTAIGFGPNMRTMVQFRVAGTAAPNPNLVTNLQTALPVAFAASQDPIIVPQQAYGASTDTFSTIQANTLSYAPIGPQTLTGFAVTSPGSMYTSAPAVALTGGGGTGAVAGVPVMSGAVASVAVTLAGSGYTSAPTVTFTGGGGTSVAAMAMVAGGTIASVMVTNPGTGYSSAPVVGFTGGSGTGPAATATMNLGVASIPLTSPGTGYTSAPLVSFTGGGGTGAAAVVTTSASVTMDLRPKCIQELFDPYGRMNATLGVEIPKTSGTIQTTIPYGYIDPPTEIIGNGETQIWKITHNGVDTHAIHFHLVNVQLINRVGWDGMIKPPEPNEIGWKETIRMNPLEDCIVAMKAVPPPVPFALPSSVRLMDVTMPEGSAAGFFGVDPNGNPITVTNQLVNYGWEYVWHCHILGHEENDMMRPLIFTVAPPAPANLTATASALSVNPPTVSLAWTNLATAPNVTQLTLQRATDAALTQNVVTWTFPPTQTTYVDTTVAQHTTYYYGISAANTLGISPWTTAPAVTTPGQLPLAPSGLAGLVAGPPLAINLSWTNNSTIAAGVQIQRATGTGAFTVLASLPATATTYSDTVVVLGTSYSYSALAFNADGFSAPSNTATVVTSPPPAPPANLVAVASALSTHPPTVSLTWTLGATPPTPTQLTLQRATDAAFTQNVVTWALASTQTAFLDATVGLHTTYYYWIRAEIALGFSAWCTAAPVTTAGQLPLAPSGLAGLVAGPPLAINLSWTNNSTLATSIQIQRATGTGAFAVLATLPAAATTYSDAAVVLSTSYSYVVYAVNADGSSPPSNTATVTTPSIPAAPANLAAVASALSSNPPAVSLTWTNPTTPPAPTQLTLQRATDAAFTQNVMTWVLPPAETKFMDGTVATHTTYYYWIRAETPFAFSAWCTAPAVTTPGIVPVAPSGLTAVLAGPPLAINLGWTNNSTIATGIRVQRAVGTGAMALLVTLPATATTYSDAAALPGMTYSYTIVAINADGSSLPSNTAIAITPTVPAAPSNLKATAAALSASPPSITLTWRVNSTNQTGFFVQRSTSARFQGTITNLIAAANATSFTDTPLPTHTTYYYRISAFNQAGYSANSNTASATTSGWLPAAPTNLTVTTPAAPAGRTSLYIKWTQVTTGGPITSYQIQRSININVSWITVANMTSSTWNWTNTGLTPKTVYYYRVRAVNADGAGAWSNIGASKTLP